MSTAKAVSKIITEAAKIAMERAEKEAEAAAAAKDPSDVDSDGSSQASDPNVAQRAIRSVKIRWNLKQENVVATGWRYKANPDDAADGLELAPLATTKNSLPHWFCPSPPSFPAKPGAGGESTATTSPLFRARPGGARETQGASSHRGWKQSKHGLQFPTECAAAAKKVQEQREEQWHKEDCQFWADIYGPYGHGDEAQGPAKDKSWASGRV